MGMRAALWECMQLYGNVQLYGNASSSAGMHAAPWECMQPWGNARGSSQQRGAWCERYQISVG